MMFDTKHRSKYFVHMRLKKKEEEKDTLRACVRAHT